MEEKQENELKQEAINVARETKETLKNVNLKEEVTLGKGFLKELVEKPVEKIESIARDKENKYFKTALLIIGLWIIVILIDEIFGYIDGYSFKYIIKYGLLSIIKAIVSPIIKILAMSIIILLYNKKNKKSLQTIITVITTAKIPIVVSYILGLITLFASSAYKIISPISGILGVTSTVLTFFAIKSLSGEEDSKAIKSFVIIQAFYYLLSFVLSYLQIYI